MKCPKIETNESRFGSHIVVVQFIIYALFSLIIFFYHTKHFLPTAPTLGEIGKRKNRNGEKI